MIGHQQQKRKNYVYEDVYEEENVDDLEFAAQFAIVTSPATDSIPTSSDTVPNQHPATKKDVNNKLDQDADENELSSDSSNDEDGTNRDTNGDYNDDDDNDERNSKETDSSEDDESDVDLSQELAKMDSDDEDEPKHGSKRNHIVVPTTQNELDVYNCPVTELEKTLDLGLEIGDVLVFEPDESGVMIARAQEDRIRLAGNIKFHMVPDRTIVVESNPHGGVAAVTSNVYHSNLAKKSLLLDEGNLLLLKVDRGNQYLGKIVDYTELRDNEFFVIPLGKILEVFGPVSKPLYTLRLTKMMTTTAAHPFHDRTCCKEKMQNIKKEDEQKDNDEMPGLSERVVHLNDSTGNATDENKTPTKEAIVTAAKKASETAVDHNNLHQEHKVKASVNEHIDPWSESGMLTKWLKASPHLEVFYCEDQVKIVDTQTILKNSRKGCDASNIYDEEVTDEKEVYYSDDEEERAAKRGNRRQNKSHDNRSLSNTGNYGGTQYPSGKHHYKRHPRTNPPYLHANPSYDQHHVSQNQQSLFHPYQYSHPNPNVPTFMPHPIRQDHYTQFGGPPLPSHSPWMQPAPPAPVIYTNMMNSGSIPPPPPPPPPRLGQQQQPYYGIPQSQHQMHHEPSQQHNYQQMRYCYNNRNHQQHQLNQENSSSANNGDTVYYNYSGS